MRTHQAVVNRFVWRVSWAHAVALGTELFAVFSEHCTLLVRIRVLARRYIQGWSRCGRPASAPKRVPGLAVSEICEEEVLLGVQRVLPL